MANDDDDAVVSSATAFTGTGAALNRAEVKLEEDRQGRASTGSYRPSGDRAGEKRGVEEGPLPANYVNPAEKYVLVEEEDRRFRLVGTAAEARVTLLETAAAPLAVDNRVRITNTTAWPNCVHGHCIITYPDNKQYIGSGTMVNKHHVLTAGHVVFSKANGGWAKTIQFNAAQNDETLPFGSAFATHVFAFKGWSEHQKRDYDTGLLILNRDLGDQTGWMGVINATDNHLSNHQITVSGYPGDKGGQQLWAASAPIATVASHQIRYNAYTKGGDSGAGVYGIWQGHNMEHVCADHVAGPNGVPNTGSRVTKDKFDRIVKDWFTK
jgi:V8-like Glu-specific endopeptidase